MAVHSLSSQSSLNVPVACYGKGVEHIPKYALDAPMQSLFAPSQLCCVPIVNSVLCKKLGLDRL